MSTLCIDLKINTISYRCNQDDSITNACSTPERKIQEENYDDDDEIIETTPERVQEPLRRYPKRNRVPRRRDWLKSDVPHSVKKAKFKPQPTNDEEGLCKIDLVYSWYKWSDCKLAERYDKERKFYPQPGPSHLNYYEDDDLTGYYRPITNIKTAKTPQTTSVQKRKTRGLIESIQKRSLRSAKRQQKDEATAENCSQASSENSDWENDIHVQSFYEQSFVQKSPEAGDSPISNGHAQSSKHKHDETEISSPILSKLLDNLKNASSESKPKRKCRADACTIRPNDSAPTHRDVKKLLNANEFPEVIHPIPFYSDPNDVIAESSKKEVGHTVLQLTGNGVNDCEEFTSQLNVFGLNKWQSIVANMSVRSSERIRENKLLENQNLVRKSLARKTGIQITPKEFPPSKKLVEKWLKRRSKSNGIKRTSARLKSINIRAIQIDSPERVRREKPISVLNESDVCIEIDDDDDGDDDDIEVEPNSTQKKYNNNHGDVKEITKKIINGLLANKELTVTSKRLTKPTSPSQLNGIAIDCNDHDEADDDDDDEDDVICLDDDDDDDLPINKQSVGKLVCSKRSQYTRKTRATMTF